MYKKNWIKNRKKLLKKNNKIYKNNILLKLWKIHYYLKLINRSSLVYSNFTVPWLTRNKIPAKNTYRLTG